MHIHHLNCGCMCPWGGALFDGYSPGLTATVPCHCLLVETERDGLVLVDTGFGYNDIQHPQRLSRFFRLFNNIRLDHRLTALDQIRRLGFDPRDVRHIVLTHLDFDHAGGLEDFPQARVHVMGEEISHATQAGGWIGSRRYRARQWQAVADWEFYPELGEQWFGFDAVRALIDVRTTFCWYPWAAIPMAMPGSHCAPDRAGCCMPAMRISTTWRCTAPNVAARQACVCISA